MLRRLSLADYGAVRRMLRAHLRHVDIARELNLGVWTVDRIAARERFAADDVAEADLLDDDAPPDYAADKLRRCPDCGAMVYVWPCLACRMAVVR